MTPTPKPKPCTHRGLTCQLAAWRQHTQPPPAAGDAPSSRSTCGCECDECTAQRATDPTVVLERKKIN